MEELLFDLLNKINFYETIVGGLILTLFLHLINKMLKFSKVPRYLFRKIKRWYNRRYKFKLSGKDLIEIHRKQKNGIKLTKWESEAYEKEIKPAFIKMSNGFSKIEIPTLNEEMINNKHNK